MNNRLPALAVLLTLLSGCDNGASTTAPDAVNATQSASVQSGTAQSGTAQSGDAVSGGGLQFVAPALSEAEIRGGWISLFDGVSLFGWQVPENANWHVENGAIVADQGEISLLRTPFHFGDFEFRCDFLMASGGNSGVFLRTAAGASNPATDTWELNICDNHPAGFNTGSLVTRHIAEGVPAVAGDWHQFLVRCEGLRIQVWLDGKPIVDFTDDSEAPRTLGQIGLQFNTGRIAFRDVFLKPLHGVEQFNGQDLTGWRTVPGSVSQFQALDGVLHVTGGPGFLETESTWDDSLLHVEARTNGDGLNSGVFFRAQPGTEAAPSNGYEMQIHNGFGDGDRTKPVDSGTGAIFRRAAARYVVASDREWLTATLIAQGHRFATWVNGYQVVDWQDLREPHENPRQGRRTDAGHVSLQGHDPTTDLDFRSVRVHPLPHPGQSD